MLVYEDFDDLIFNLLKSYGLDCHPKHRVIVKLIFLGIHVCTKTNSSLQ